MAAGPKRHRLTIQQDQPTTREADGSSIPNWTTIATVWAEGGPLAGRELWQAQQAESEVTHRFKVRWSSAINDLSGSVRIFLRDRLFHLVDYLNLEEWNKELQLDCKEAPDQRRVVLDPSGSPIFDPSGNVIQEP